MNQRQYHSELLSQVGYPYSLELEQSAKHHLTVIRAKVGQTIHLIDGSGGYFECQITRLDKKCFVDVIGYVANSLESGLSIHLAQVVSRGDKMDLTIQKAVELGVNEITPLFAQKCGVNLSGDRLDKKMQHWKNIIVSACLQSGRNTIPKLNPAQDINQFIKNDNNDFKIQLDPRGKFSLNQISKFGYDQQAITLLIGSESGLTQTEVDVANDYGFNGIKLGPRILRTETAGLSVIAILQAIYGDLN